MKNWIREKRYVLITAFLGGLLGYLYWHFIGCSSGSCAITSVWWRSTIYGIIMGWLLGDVINDKFNSKTKNNEQVQ